MSTDDYDLDLLALKSGLGQKNSKKEKDLMEVQGMPSAGVKGVKWGHALFPKKTVGYIYVKVGITEELH